MNIPALARQLEEASEAKIAALAHRYRLEPEEVRTIADADPTGGSATEWLVRHAAAGTLRFPEDAGKMREQLQQFQILKRKSTYAGEKDLNRLDPAGLYRLLQDHAGTVGKKERVRMAAQQGVREMGSAGGFTVWEVTTPEAGAKLFRNTNWCVKDPEYFNDYGPPFYMVTDAQGGPHALYHPESDSFKDRDDADFRSGEELPMARAFEAAGLIEAPDADRIHRMDMNRVSAITRMSMTLVPEREVAGTRMAFWFANRVLGRRLGPEAEAEARTHIDDPPPRNADADYAYHEVLTYMHRFKTGWFPELEPAAVRAVAKGTVSGFDMDWFVTLRGSHPWPELTAVLEEMLRDDTSHNQLVLNRMKQWWYMHPKLRPLLPAAAYHEIQV